MRRLVRFAPALVFAAAAVAQMPATSNLGCSTATLAGTYAFTITGQILAPPPAAGPVAGVTRTIFDGYGNLVQIDNVVHNGTPPAEEWRPAIGTYTVNSDCTGTFTFTPQPAVAKDASPALTVHFIVTPDGSQIRAAVTSSPTAPPFMAAITAMASEWSADSEGQTGNRRVVGPARGDRLRYHCHNA